MNRRTETLAKISLFQSLDARAIGLLDSQCSWRSATGGQWLIDYQDASNDVFFVVTGAVRRLIRRHRDGRKKRFADADKACMIARLQGGRGGSAFAVMSAGSWSASVIGMSARMNRMIVQVT